MPIAAEVIQIAGKMGIKGVSRVRCRVIGTGGSEHKTLVRNVIGPVKRGDVIMLKETEMDTEAGFQKR